MLRLPTSGLCLVLLLAGCDGGSSNPVTATLPEVPVALESSAVPQLKVTPASLSFTSAEGGANPPGQKIDISVKNNRPGGIRWTATASEPWITLQPASGTVTGGMHDKITVKINANYQAEAWTGQMSTVNAPATGFGAWIGNRLLIWGENNQPVGRFYDPATNAWSGSTSTTNAPQGRTLHTSIWTGTEFIVWGGITFWGGTPLNDGGRYNPATDTWSPVSTINAPDPRFAHSAVWTGTNMVVWGGDSGGFSYKDSGGVYDPATDTWVRSTSMTNAPAARGYHTAAWTGSRMMVWGGENPGKFGDGAFYDPAADAWVGVPTLANAPTARSHLSCVWTGREVIVWGGGSGGPHLDTGARYNPATDTWTGATTMLGVAEPKASFVGAWTGSRMIVWGGESNGVLSNHGWFYRPPLPAEGPNAATITITASGASGSPVVVPLTLTVTP